MKTLISILLAASLITATCHAQQQPKLVAECVVLVVIGVTTAVIVVGLNSLCKKLPQPNSTIASPPACTNAPPSGTNRAPAKLTMQLLTDDFTAYDLTDNPPQNTDPDGNPWLRYIEFTVQSSTNLTDWKPIACVTNWLNQTYLLTVTDHSTNCDRLGNGAFVPAFIGNENKEFFRIR